MRRAIVTAAALLALTGACSSPGEVPPQVRDDLRAQAEAQNALRERIGELEQQLEDLRAAVDEDVDATPLLDEIDQRLEQLSSDLVSETTVREEAITELRSAVSEIRDSISAVESAVAELRRELGDLRSRHNLLEQRFDSHERHPPG